MPRFFLHQIHRDTRIEDLEGADFADLNEARQEAILSALEIMSDRIKVGVDPDHSRFEIEDEAGQVVLILPFNAATE